MKRFLFYLLLAVCGAGIVGNAAEGGAPPVIKQRDDGVVFLNTEAAAFVMSDKMGRHVMNWTNPRLQIAQGRIVNTGEAFQFPGWSFEVSKPGKFEVYLEVGAKNSEDCVMRASFFQKGGKGEAGRLLTPVPRGGSDTEPLFLGEVVLQAGLHEVLLGIWAADHPKRLPEIGNLVLVPVSGEVAQAFDALVRRSPLAKNDTVTKLEKSFRDSKTEFEQVKKAWDPKADPSKFQDYSEIMRWDHNKARLDALQAALLQLPQKIREAQIAALDAAKNQLSPEDRAILTAYVDRRHASLAKMQGLSSKVGFEAKPSGPTPLFPVGDLDKLKEPEIPSKVPVVSFDVPPPADASARRAAFAERNSEAGLKALCSRLHAALLPGVSGLDEFYTLFDKGSYAEALNAYRDYFFRKLKSPEKYGAEGGVFLDDFGQNNGKAGHLRRPHPDWLAANLDGTAVLMEAGTVWKGKVGEPGTVNWAPESLKLPEGVLYGRGPDNNPFWKTPEGRLLSGKITFFRGLNRQLGEGEWSAIFPQLLFSYCFNGNKDHLKLYADYLDDWAMNSAWDVDNCPVNIRAATELQVIGWYRPVLRSILDERPEFATDFPAPTLARMMMYFTEMCHPYVIRAKRSELANWGIMGVDSALNESKLFHEFRAMDYSNRECSRLARINWIQHLSLDGEGLEAWDEGHMAIDHMLKSALRFSLYGAPVLGDLERQSFIDHVKTSQRALVTHFSPDGNYWMPWLSADDSARATIRGKILPRCLIEDVLDEAEVRSRYFAALGRTPRKSTPPLSDVQPYAALFYLRDGFGQDCSSLLLKNFPIRSQTQAWGYNLKRGHIVGCMRTDYNVARDGRAVLEGSPIIVDSKPPNMYVGATPTGGKTDFSFQTPRNVQPGRFLASPEWDVIETLQDSPYQRYGFAFNREILGFDQTTPDEPIRDVRTCRQVFHLRGEGIFVIGDQVENQGANHEFAQMFAMPTRVYAPFEMDRLRLLANKNALLLDIDKAAKRVRSLSPGLPNVSLYLAGHEFTWGGRTPKENVFDPVDSVSAKSSYEQVCASRDPERWLSENRIKVVSVRWQGKGNQALASVVLTRPEEADPDHVSDKDFTDFHEMNGPNGVAGCSFRSPLGTDVWFQIAPSRRAQLRAGPGQISGGTLLVTRREGRLSGVVINANEVNLDGRMFRGPSDAFAFSLEKDGKFIATPVRAPIDTVVIQPQQTVFIDKVKVAFDIPTQKRDDIEYRYTLDGTDPTIESPLYTGPFELASDAIVKVRPFLKGLKQTPWNIAGVEAGKTVSAIFRKTAPLPSLKADVLRPGLRYQYFEGPWAVLMSHSGMYPFLPVKSSGESAGLLDPNHLAQIRQTDRAFAVKYDGVIDLPETGVYRFFAPEPLYNTTKDAGYELRVWIDGREWFPNPDLHAENIWSVAIEKGLHRFQVSYVDYRWKVFRNEYLMSWNPKQMWSGVPVLELDGPGLQRQAVPQKWLKCSIQAMPR